MGAIRIAGTWYTTASPTRLWTVVTDLATWPRWWPAITAAEAIRGGPGAPEAAHLTFDTPRPLRPLVITLVVTHREPPGRLVVAIDRGPLTGDGTVTVIDGEDGGTVGYDVRLQVRSLLFKPIEPVLAGGTRSGGRARLARAGDDLAQLAGGHLVEHVT